MISLRTYSILSAIILCLLYQGVIVPQKKEYRRLSAIYASNLKKIEVGSRKSANLPSLKHEMGKATTRIQLINTTLPDALNPDQLTTAISRAGLDAGVALSDTILNHAPTSKGFYSEHPVTIKASGNLPALTGFMSRLTQIEPIVELIATTFVKTPGTPLRYDTELLVKTYRFLPKIPGRPKKRIGNGVSRPATHALLPVFLTITLICLSIACICVMLGTGVSKYYHTWLEARSSSNIPVVVKTLFISTICFLSALLVTLIIPQVIISIKVIDTLIGSNSITTAGIHLESLTGGVVGFLIICTIYFTLAFTGATLASLVLTHTLKLKEETQRYLVYALFLLCAGVPMAYLFSETLGVQTFRWGVRFAAVLGMTFFAARLINAQIRPNTRHTSIFYRRKTSLLAVLILFSAVTIPIVLDWFMGAEGFAIRGYRYHNQKNYSFAIRDYTKAINLDQEYLIALKNRGHAYFKTEQYSKAISDFDAALELTPDNGSLYHSRGLAHELSGHVRRALSDYSAAIEFNHNSPGPYHNRGSLYYTYNLTQSA